MTLWLCFEVKLPAANGHLANMRDISTVKLTHDESKPTEKQQKPQVR